MPVGILWTGNSSRTIPNESGNTPPPMPCSARPTIISAQAVAERADDRADREGAERDGQEALLAEHVAEAPEHRRGDRRGEEVAR